jgi:hypothetical protein
MPQSPIIKALLSEIVSGNATEIYFPCQICRGLLIENLSTDAQEIQQVAFLFPYSDFTFLNDWRKRSARWSTGV